MEEKDYGYLWSILEPTKIFNNQLEMEDYLNQGNSLEEFWPQIEPTFRSETLEDGSSNPSFDMFLDSTDFFDYVAELKKKDLDAVAPLESDTLSPSVSGGGSLDYTASETDPNEKNVGLIQGSDTTWISQGEYQLLQRQQETPDSNSIGASEQQTGYRYVINDEGQVVRHNYLPAAEIVEDAPPLPEDEFIPGLAGRVVRGIPFVGEFIDDMVGAVGGGILQGRSGAQAMDLQVLGEDASDEEIQEYIEAYEAAANFGGPNEIREFGQIYEEAGGGFFGFLKAMAQRPGALPMMFAQSITSQLANEKAVGAGLVTGAGATLVSSPIGGFLTGMTVAGGVSETASVFSQELGEMAGEDFNIDDVRDVLEDDEKLSLLRRRSVVKGGTTAALDFATAKAGIGTYSRIIRGGRGLPTIARRIVGTGATVTVEGVGSGLAEAGGQIAAFGELDEFEVFTEVFVGSQGAPVTIAMAATKTPKYFVNGKRYNRNEFIEIIQGMDRSEVQALLEMDNKTRRQINKDAVQYGGQISDEGTVDVERQGSAVRESGVVSLEVQNDPNLSAALQTKRAIQQVEDDKSTEEDKKDYVKNDEGFYTFFSDDPEVMELRQEWVKARREWNEGGIRVQEAESRYDSIKDDPSVSKEEVAQARQEYFDAVEEYSAAGDRTTGIGDQLDEKVGSDAWRFDLNWEEETQEQTAKLKEDKDVAPKPEPTDPLANEVMEFISEQDEVNMSAIMRKFKLGYNRSNKIINELVEAGLVSPFDPEKGFVVVPEDQRPTSKPETKPETTETTGLRERLTILDNKLEDAKKREEIAAERRLERIKNTDRYEEYASLQEKINRMEAKLKRGKERNGKPLSKRRRSGLRKGINNAYAEIDALFKDMGVEAENAEVRFARDAREQLQEERNDVAAELETTEAELKKIKKDESSAGSKKSLDAQVSALEEMIADLKKQRKSYEDANLGTSREAQELNLEINKRQRELGDLKVKANEARMATERLKRKSVDEQLASFGLDKDRNAQATIRQFIDPENPKIKTELYLGSLINRPTIMYGVGKKGKEGLKADLRGVLSLNDSNELVFRTHDGTMQYILGDLNDINLESKSTDMYLMLDKLPTPVISRNGILVKNGIAYTIPMTQENFGITRGKNGSIVAVELIGPDGDQIFLRGRPLFEIRETIEAYLNSTDTPVPKVIRVEDGTTDTDTSQDTDTETTPDDQDPPQDGGPTPPDDQDPPQDGGPTPPDDGPPETSGPPAGYYDPNERAIPPEERARRLKEDGVFVPSEGIFGGVVDAFTRLKRRWFSDRKFFPLSVQRARDYRNGKMNLIINRTEKLANEFNKKWKSITKAYTPEQRETLLKDLDAVLRGEATDEQKLRIPVPLFNDIMAMRQDIDALSQQLIDNGVVPNKDRKLKDGTVFNPAQNIMDNMGSYITRSYELYDGNARRWQKNLDEETKQQAVEYFIEKSKDSVYYKRWLERNQEMNFNGRDPLTVFAELQVENVLAGRDAVGTSSAALASGSSDAVNAATLKFRKDLDPRLRALLGERQDPVANYAVTMSKLGALVEKAKFLEEVRKLGEGVFLFKGTPDVGAGYFNTDVPAMGMDPNMNPLQGYRTSPEIAQAFEEQNEAYNNESSGLWRTFKKVQSIMKWNKTIGSAVTHMRNIEGNLGFVIANGHFTGTGTSLMSLSQLTGIKLGKSGFGKADRDYFNRLTELGVIGQQTNLQELRELWNMDPTKALEQRYTNRGSALHSGAIKRGFKKWTGVDAANWFYQASDDFYKIRGFEIERRRYAQSLFGVDFGSLTPEQQQQVDDKAADIIKNVYPNYNRIGAAVKGLSKSPILGTFLAFQHESYRNAWNTFALAREELASGNPKLRMIGAKRLAGMGAYMSFRGAATSARGAAIGYGLMAFSQGGEEVEREKRTFDNAAYFLPPWTKAGYKAFGNQFIGGNTVSHDIQITEVGKGKYKYIDYTTVDPFGASGTVFNRIFAGLEGRGGDISDNDLVDAVMGGMVEFIGPFVEEDMTFAMTRQLLNNRKDQTGSPIYNPDDPMNEKLMDMFEFADAVILPSTFDQISKLNSDEPLESYGETDGEKLQAMMGMREVTVDVTKQFGYICSDFSKRFNESRKDRNEGVTLKEREQGLLKDHRQRIELMKELSLAYMAASDPVFEVHPADLKNELQKSLIGAGLTGKVFENGQITFLDLIMSGDLDLIERIPTDYDKLRLPESND